MKVLIAAPFAINTPHFETALELAQRHLDEGDEVIMLECDAHLFSCDANPNHGLHGCGPCIARRRAGLRLLSAPIRTAPVYRLGSEDRQRLAGLKVDFTSAESLKACVVDGFDIGYAALSSLISVRRSSTPELAERRNARLLRRILVTAYAVFLSTHNYLRAENPDRVYVYNGRYAPTRAVLRACQQAGVECMLHEVGSTLQHYALFRNRMPFELAHIEALMRETWAQAPDSVERERVARGFFENQARGIVESWFSYTADQQADRLPEGWRPDRHNVAIFNSSEDEFAAYSDEWRSPLYESQLDGLQRLLKDLGGEAGLHLYLRVHPNLRNVKDGFTAGLERLSAPNFTLIPAASKVSSYALLQASDTVLTFGSQMGIEATYWGKPSVLAGVSLYRNLGATYNPASHAELVELLRAKLAPKPVDGAL
ncbi:MAG TPA: hypothetical protein VK043_09250, partial [Burkholderiales bacterium]|nr:hypothetical protein [Burkholderiales bacterium]